MVKGEMEKLEMLIHSVGVEFWRQEGDVKMWRYGRPVLTEGVGVEWSGAGECCGSSDISPDNHTRNITGYKYLSR